MPSQLLETMVVGHLDESDQDKIDEMLNDLYEKDPYAREPDRNSNLRVHSETPMNAEVPEELMTQSYLTPNDLFYIRHHHPVPYLTQTQVENYTLHIDLGNGKVADVSLEDLKKLPRIERVATLQCSGNRRGDFNNFERTSGTPWGTYGMSTCVFTIDAHFMRRSGSRFHGQICRCTSDGRASACWTHC